MPTGMHKVLGSTVALLALAACATLSQRDPLFIDVAGIEQVPGEGMELNLAVRIRVQNPNDTAVRYDGLALALDVNGRTLASGLSDDIGTVPRYGQKVITIPVTISAFDVARQVFGAMDSDDPAEVRYELRGKLDGGLFGTRRFTDRGMLRLAPPQRRQSN